MSKYGPQGIEPDRGGVGGRPIEPVAYKLRDVDVEIGWYKTELITTRTTAMGPDDHMVCFVPLLDPDRELGPVDPVAIDEGSVAIVDVQPISDVLGGIEDV